MFDPSNDPDRDKLITFTNDVNKFVQDDVLLTRAYFIHTNYRGIFADLWNGNDNQQRFGRLQAAIRTTAEEALEDHGLIGAELSAKISTVKHTHSRWIQRGGSFLLKKLIDAIDTLLDSIIEAVGVGGAIKELKEMLKNIVEED